MIKKTYILLTLVILLLVIAVLYVFRSNSVSCTLEALICPDGSAVGRQGPNCEFTPCPQVGNTPNTSRTPAEPPTIQRTFGLATYNNIFYRFVWNAYKVDESECDDFVSDNVTKVNFNLIKDNLDLGVTSLVATTSLNPHCSGDSGLEITSAPYKSPQILITQWCEGRGCINDMLVNLESGQITQIYEILNKTGGNCMYLEPDSTHQKGIVFSCDDPKTNLESIYSLDIATGTVKKIRSLNSGSTFRCLDGYGHSFSFKYITDQSVKIDICSSNKTKKDQILIAF